MSSFRFFWDEFQERFSRAPVWLPGSQMELGDIGIIDRRGWLRVAALGDFGIEFDVTPSEVKSDYSVNSTSATTDDFAIEASLEDPAANLASIGTALRVNFSESGGFVVRARRVEASRIKDVLEVENRIRDLHARNSFWQRRWIYVQEIVTAKPCILMVAGASGSSATLRAEGRAGLGSLLEAMDAGSHATLSENRSVDQYIATPERAPLMWRGRWLRGFLAQKFVSRGAGDASEELAVSELYEDFDDPEAFEREPD
jgi:hypothetical protein